MNENTLSNIDDCQRGMTLIELLAVLLIAGMLTGWGVGQWRHHQQALRLEHTGQQLLAFYCDCRRRLTGATARRCCGSSTAPLVPGRWCAAAGLRFRRGAGLSSPYPDVVLRGYTGKEIGFYGLRNTAQAGHILLSNDAGGLRLVLSVRGRLRLCSEGHRIRGIGLC